MNHTLCIGGPLDGQRIVSAAHTLHAPETQIIPSPWYGDPAMTNMRYDRVRLASGHEIFMATTVSDPIETLIEGYRDEQT